MKCVRLTQIAVVCCLLLGLSARPADAQTFGIQLYNTLMPASGGMAGASLASPQDLQSAINGNPATLTQFQGTQFSFGGAWAEPTYNIDNDATLPLAGISPYSAKSGTPGSALPNIGVTQDFSALGKPVSVGLGLLSNAGFGVDFRDVNASNGTSMDYLALDIVLAAGMSVNDRLAVGASFVLGNSFMDGPFQGISAMVPDYALRGSVGATYDLGYCTTLGAYWQTKKSFTFDDAIRLQLGPGSFAVTQDIRLDHPQTFGLGVSNESLCDGRLLLAADVLFIDNQDAAFLKDIYDNQWVMQLGMQYKYSRSIRLRLGYAYNENPMRDIPGSSVGGVGPVDPLAGVQYIQSQMAVVSQHRFTGGVGMRDILPGIDFDLFAGGMFEGSDTFGATTASVESYWIGAGLTWRFGRGACQRLPVPDDWGCDSLCDCE